MIGCGMLIALVMLAAIIQTVRGKVADSPRLLRICLYSLPLPWFSIEAGWFMTEFGRQPWAIQDVLPTAAANSALTAGQLWFSILLICGLYTLFLIAEVYLMIKFARLGPSSLHTGRYALEQASRPQA